MQRLNDNNRKVTRRDKTTTAQNKTATLQYKPYDDRGILHRVGNQLSSFAFSTTATLFGYHTEDTPATTNPSLQKNNPKTEIDLKLEKLHAQLEGTLRQQLKDVEDKIKATQDKSAKDTLTNEKRKIRAKMDFIRVEKVKLIPELIREHANRRVDYFFYLCVLVYKTGVTIEKGSTDRQHGDGDKSVGTAACHSCLIPNPVLTPGAGLAATAFSQLPAFMQKLLLYFQSQQEAETRETDDIFIRDSFNSTVLLPIIVNKFDNLLEGTVTNPSELVLKSLEIANRVSQGEINPLQAMDEFGIAINTFFNGLEKTYNYEALVSKPDTKNPKSLSLILKYQREGTHRVINSATGAAYRDHFYMLLGFDHRLSWLDYPASLSPLRPRLENHILALQQELLDPPLIIDPVLPFKLDELAILSGGAAASKVISFYESYETRAKLLASKFKDRKQTQEDCDSIHNLQHNMQILAEITARLDTKSKKDIKKFSTAAEKASAEAVEAYKSLDLSTGSQSMLQMN